LIVLIGFVTVVILSSVRLTGSHDQQPFLKNIVHLFVFHPVSTK